MKTTFIILLTLCFFCVKGQSNDHNQFINNFYKGRDTILYFKTLDKFTIKQLEKVFSEDTLIGVFEDTNKKFSLTEAERLFIKKELHEFMSDNTWSYKLFKKIKGIPVDSSFNGKDFERLRISSFSRPIFIRKKAFCFFYNGYKCGKGEFVLYKRKNNNWSPYIVLYKWVS